MILVASCAAYTQATPEPEQVIRVQTSLVNIPVIVSDHKGRRIPGLKKEDFSIFSGSKELGIEFFADVNEPIHYAIVIDTSGSTSPVIGSIRNAAKKFASSFGPNDKGIVFSFDASVHPLMSGFSSDSKRINTALNLATISESPGSVMNDAIGRLIDRDFAMIKGRKAIIVLTDGDVEGKTTRPELFEKLAASDIVVYSIFFPTRRLFPERVKSVSFAELVEIEPVNYLYSLARLNGGRLLVAGSHDFESAFASIVEEIRKQYLVGFYLDLDEETKKMEISIKVRHNDAIVRTKEKIRSGLK